MEGSVCCQQFPRFLKVCTAFVVIELHLSHREWRIRRVEGVSGRYPSVTRRHGMEGICHVWVCHARVLHLLQ